MRNHILLFALSIMLITSCATTQPGPRGRFARHSRQGSAVPFGAESQPGVETSSSPVQVASLSAATLPTTAPAESGSLFTSLRQPEQYRLRNGDVITVKFVKNPELDATVPVRPDGHMALALVGETMAKGLTLAELRTAISRQYTDFVTQTGYGEVLKEGDSFDLRLVYNPELNLGVRIRSDGKISLPLLGELQAAGLRPAELREQLVKEYGKHITDPDVALLIGPDTAKKIFAEEPFIAVTLSKSADQEIFVGGEVLSPKAVKFEGQITVLQALLQAGGVKDTADLSQVVVLRRGQFEESNWIQTDLSNPLSGNILENDLTLHNGDVVVVPLSGIGKVGLFVKQYIRDVLPVQSSAGVTFIPVNTGR